MMEFKVIVVRQPWAWLIVNGYKDIENRSWHTNYQGMLLIQASASRGKTHQASQSEGDSGSSTPETRRPLVCCLPTNSKRAVS